MKISAINTNYTKKYTIDSQIGSQIGSIMNGFESFNDIKNFEQGEFLLNLEAMAFYNMPKVSFKSSKHTDDKFTLNFSLNELQRRVAPEAFTEYRMLEVGAPEYNKLAQRDKKALKHLVKAAQQFDSVYLRQDNAHNLAFQKFIEKEAARGNKKSILTKKLFEAQKTITGKSVDSKPVCLAKNIEPKPGKGFYPEDMSPREFHKIITDMLRDGEDEEVRKILNQRTMVLRDGEKLKAVDYTEYFKEQFCEAADELEKAAYYTTDDDFAMFLKYQAEALRNNNPELDAKADKKWAQLQNTPLEFTIGRECYDDMMTPTISKNKKLSYLLEKHGIIPYTKDNLGVRVGIVNKEGTDYILKIKEYLPLMAAAMPFNDQYEQSISTNAAKNNKQTMVDVDIVSMTGRFGAYSGGISLASNLPNNDKLAIHQGGGKRNVYHRQCREAKYSDNMENILNTLVDKSQHRYFDVDALHDFTILHENVHSLGPKDGLEALGVYKNVIEEHKADAGALVMLDLLTKEGFYSTFKKKQVITSFLTAYVLKGQDFNDAHKRRNILQHNYFIKHGAVELTKEGKMKIDFDKVIDCAHEMLENAIKIQMSKDPLMAERYLEKNAVWSSELEKLSENLRNVDKRLNSYVTMPLAERLLNE